MDKKLAKYKIALIDAIIRKPGGLL